jgi:hypothetical protein
MATEIIQKNELKMGSIFKMTVLGFSIRPSESCIFAISNCTIFKFWIFIENNIENNFTYEFFDLLSIKGVGL